MGYAKGPSDRGPGKGTNTGGGSSSTRGSGGGAAARARARRSTPKYSSTYGPGPINRSPHKDHNRQRDNRDSARSTRSSYDGAPVNRSPNPDHNVQRDYRSEHLRTDDYDRGFWGNLKHNLDFSRFGKAENNYRIYRERIQRYDREDRDKRWAENDAAIAAANAPGLSRNPFGDTYGHTPKAPAASPPSSLGGGGDRNPYGDTYGHTPPAAPTPQGGGGDRNPYGDSYGHTPVYNFEESTTPAPSISFSDEVGSPPVETAPAEEKAPAYTRNPFGDTYGHVPSPGPKPGVATATRVDGSKGAYNPAPPGFSAPTLQSPVSADPYGGNIYRATHERNKLRRNPTGVGADLKAEKAAGELGLPQQAVNTEGVVQEILRSAGAQGSVLGGIIQAQAAAPGGRTNPGNPGAPGAVGNTGVATNTQSALRSLLAERERRGLYRTDRNLQNVNLSPFAPGRQRLF